MDKILCVILSISLLVFFIIGAYTKGINSVSNRAVENFKMSEEFFNNYVDMRQVVDFNATKYDIQLYTADGSGYYWER